MVSNRSPETDMRIGYVIVLGALAVAGALAMLLAPGELPGAAGFATAVIAGLLLVVALHLA